MHPDGDLREQVRLLNDVHRPDVDHARGLQGLDELPAQSLAVHVVHHFLERKQDMKTDH